MEEILYFDGCSACAKKAQVLLFQNQLQVQTSDEAEPVENFSFSGMSYNQVGNSYYTYLDRKGMQYLQFPLTHPLVVTLTNRIDENNHYWGKRLLKQRTIALFCLMILLGSGLYVGLIHLIPIVGSRMIGVHQEIQMGARLKELMLNEQALLGAHINTLGTQKLQAFADELNLSDQYPIQLTLVQSDIINAYALPGGQVVVYTGLLEKIKTPEALAALLAHESSHVNERHSLNGLMRNAANGIMLAVVFNDASGISGAVLSNANTLSGLRYSRSLEKEADEKGCDLLMQNGLDVSGMLELMQVLQEIGDVPHTLSFLSTHPLTKERITATKNYRQQHGGKIEKRKDLKILFDSLKLHSCKRND